MNRQSPIVFSIVEVNDPAAQINVAGTGLDLQFLDIV
jgi:hypothetical protein